MTDQLIEEVRRLLSGHEVELLAYLEPFLSEAQLQHAIEVALYIDDPRSTRVITALVSSRPGEGKTALLNMARKRHSKKPLHSEFAELISLVPESESKEALRAIVAMLPELEGWTGPGGWWVAADNWQAQVLVALAPQLSEALLLEAVRLSLRDPSSKLAQAVPILVPLLPEAERPKIAVAALPAARAIIDPLRRVKGLTVLLPYLIDPNHREVVAEATAVLLPYLIDANRLLTAEEAKLKTNPEYFFPDYKLTKVEADAISMLMDFYRDEGFTFRYTLLAALAPHLSEQLIHEVVTMVRTTLDPLNRAQGLAALLPVLPQTDQFQGAMEALKTVQEAQIPEGLWGEEGREIQVGVLISLIPYLPAELQHQTAHEAKWSILPATRTYKEKLQSYFRAKLALYLPEQKPPPDSEYGQFLRLHEIEMTGIEPSPVPPLKSIPGISPTYLRHLFRQLAESDRTLLLNELLAVLYTWFAPEYLYGPMSQRDLPSAPTSKGRSVSTGFATSSDPDVPLDRDLPLISGESYYFWLHVGASMPESIETITKKLPTALIPKEARLTVVLFTTTGGIALSPNADVGELQLQPNGVIQVIRQPMYPPQLLPTSDILKQRLFFPIHVPANEGRYTLLCNIYYEHILIQSRRVSVQAERQPQRKVGALQSTLVYSLSQRIDPNDLSRIEPHRLSLQLSDNLDGTHSFAFIGTYNKELFKHAVKLSEGSLQNWIDEVRKGLRQVAWGDEEPWAASKLYRYGREPHLDQLRDDLVRLAIKGWRLYYNMNLDLAGNYENLTLLMELMQQPGMVLIANQASQNCILPASLIYDYKFDTNAGPLKAYTLCNAFLEALNEDSPLEELRCFKGDCPSRGKRTIVCPSGFWGYRHMLGMPPATTEPPALYYHDPLHLFVGVSTDKSFQEREAHELALQRLYQPLEWTYAATRNDALDLLGKSKPHMVYFYCHGGWDKDENIPYLQVGPITEYGITPDNLGWPDIYWDSPRPLVFINGCHTTALEPQKAVEFVSAFVGHANACGVIGTEITVFEPLARRFAEECLRRFLVEHASIGEAVRGARLALLKQRNPLGLVYTPFVLASLRLVMQQGEMVQQS